MPAEPNIQQAVPFLMITSMDDSLPFYVEGLGFQRTKQWIVDGKIRWCWLQLEGAALMLQEYHPDRVPTGTLGQGVAICFQCKDALAIYRDATARGVKAREPFVGNSMWVTVIFDPDGYKLDFESPTDVLEETTYSDFLQTNV